MEQEKSFKGMLFPLGKEMKAFDNVIIGKSYALPLLSTPLSITNTVYEPGCRINWHIHKALEDGGQILIVTKGFGMYQEWQKPVHFLKPGDVVNIPANIKHWHGAVSNSWCEMISIIVPGRGLATEWFEGLTDEEYKKLFTSEV